MIVEYDTRNCRFCGEAILAKWQANCSLPIGEKISVVDRFSHDPRTKLLERLKEEYKGVYLLPVFLIKNKKGSSIIMSVLDSFHLKTFFKEQANII